MMNETNRELKQYDIHWANLPSVEGSSMQKGVHPCLILQNDIGNKYSPNVQVCTFTSQIRKNKLPTNVSVLKDNMNNLTKDSVIQVESVTNIPKFLIGDYIGTIDEKTMELVDRALKIQFGMNKKVSTFGVKEVIKIIKEVEEINMKIIENKIFSITKLKELYDMTQNKDMYKLYTIALDELKSYCGKCNRLHTEFYNDNDIVDTNIACAV